MMDQCPLLLPHQPSSPIDPYIQPFKVAGNTFTVDIRYDFKQSRIMGRGSFGIVSRAYDTIRNVDVAIKRIRPFAEDIWDAVHHLREIKIIKRLSFHPNIISLYDLSINESKKELYMYLELMDSDLARIIHSSQPLTENHYKCFMKQILEGVRAMHSLGIFHRDLKPGNILLTKDCHIRIADLGLARYMHHSTLMGENTDKPMTHAVVTTWYRCLELLLSPVQAPYSAAIDIWSVGCIFAELMIRRPLFPGKNHLHQIQSIFNTVGYYTPEELGFPLTAEAKAYLRSKVDYHHRPWDMVIPAPFATDASMNLLEGLLTIDPHKRITAEEALQMAYMKDAPCYYNYDALQAESMTQKLDPEEFFFEEQYVPLPLLKELLYEEIMSCDASAYRRPFTPPSLPTPPAIHSSSPASPPPASAADQLRKQTNSNSSNSNNNKNNNKNVNNNHHNNDPINDQEKMNSTTNSSGSRSSNNSKNNRNIKNINHDGSRSTTTSKKSRINEEMFCQPVIGYNTHHVQQPQYYPQNDDKHNDGHGDANQHEYAAFPAVGSRLVAHNLNNDSTKTIVPSSYAYLHHPPHDDGNVHRNNNDQQANKIQRSQPVSETNSMVDGQERDHILQAPFDNHNNNDVSDNQGDIVHAKIDSTHTAILDMTNQNDNMQNNNNDNYDMLMKRQLTKDTDNNHTMDVMANHQQDQAQHAAIAVCSTSNPTHSNTHSTASSSSSNVNNDNLRKSDILMNNENNRDENDVDVDTDACDETARAMRMVMQHQKTRNNRKLNRSNDNKEEEAKVPQEVADQEEQKPVLFQQKKTFVTRRRHSDSSVASSSSSSSSSSSFTSHSNHTTTSAATATTTSTINASVWLHKRRLSLTSVANNPNGVYNQQNDTEMKPDASAHFAAVKSESAILASKSADSAATATAVLPPPASPNPFASPKSTPLVTRRRRSITPPQIEESTSMDDSAKVARASDNIHVSKDFHADTKLVETKDDCKATHKLVSAVSSLSAGTAELSSSSSHSTVDEDARKQVVLQPTRVVQRQKTGHSSVDQPSTHRKTTNETVNHPTHHHQPSSQHSGGHQHHAQPTNPSTDILQVARSFLLRDDSVKRVTPSLAHSISNHSISEKVVGVNRDGAANVITTQPPPPSSISNTLSNNSNGNGSNSVNASTSSGKRTTSFFQLFGMYRSESQEGQSPNQSQKQASSSPTESQKRSKSADMPTSQPKLAQKPRRHTSRTSLLLRPTSTFTSFFAGISSLSSSNANTNVNLNSTNNNGNNRHSPSTLPPVSTRNPSVDTTAGATTSEQQLHNNLSQRSNMNGAVVGSGGSMPTALRILTSSFSMHEGQLVDQHNPHLSVHPSSQQVSSSQDDTSNSIQNNTATIDSQTNTINNQHPHQQKFHAFYNNGNNSSTSNLRSHLLHRTYSSSTASSSTSMFSLYRSSSASSISNTNNNNNNSHSSSNNNIFTINEADNISTKEDVQAVAETTTHNSERLVDQIL